MKFIFFIIFFFVSIYTFAGESAEEYIPNNSLVATYYSNASCLLVYNPHKSIYWVDKAISESQITGNNLDLGKSLFLKAMALENIHQNDASVKFFCKSLSIAKEFKLSDLEMDVITKLSSIYAASGNYKSALMYAVMLKERKDSINLVQQRNLAKTIPAKFDLPKSEKKKKQILADNSVLDNSLRSNLKLIDNQGNWILIIVIGYSLIFISFIIFKRQNKLILLKTHALTDQMHILEMGKMELERNWYKAEESERLKTAFLANISHEIRTPLNAIVGFSGFLRQKGKPPAERNKYITIIHHSSIVLLSLIQEIFEAARIESGEIKQEPELIELNDFLNKIKTQCCLENTTAIENGLKLNLKIQNNEEQCYFKTYPERLKNVVLHLIENAIKYSENGNVEFGYVVKEQFIEFYVMDDGKGFSIKKINSTFERFRMTNDFSKPESSHLGLGLTISKNFIDSMGGNIWVSRNDLKGTTFYFTLPEIK